MTKEEFNSIWKDTSREGILNQFYYDYMYMKKLKEDINKAIEITHKLLMNSADNRLIAKEEEMEYFDWLDRTLEEQLEILEGSENNR